jgi:hypothetical protein
MSWSAAAQSGPTVPAYNYYLDPPFVSDQGGLAQELVDYLNLKLAGEYRLKLVNEPHARVTRARLNEPATFGGIVLFAHPRFVDDPQQTRFLWTPGMFKDSAVLVFSGATAPPVKELTALTGKLLGGIPEHRYKGLDEMVAKGALRRLDSSSESVNLKLLEKGRIDFTLMGASTFNALRDELQLAGSIASLPVPGDPEFQRQILVGNSQPELAARLGKIVTAMPTDPQWRPVVQRYQLAH